MTNSKSNPTLEEYRILLKNGFLPDSLPLQRLQNPYYEPWETVVRNFQSFILSKRLRQIVDALPILSTDLLLSDAEWRRTYSILGSIAHAYIWGGDSPAEVNMACSSIIYCVVLTMCIRSFPLRSRYHFSKPASTSRCPP